MHRYELKYALKVSPIKKIYILTKLDEKTIAADEQDERPGYTKPDQVTN